MSRGRAFVQLVVVVAVLLGAMASARALPSDYVWRTLETEHFRISYHQGLESMARQLARTAEAVYGELTVFLEWTPAAKTEIALVDHVDTPNGMVNVYPYNKMILYAVPPDGRSVLNDYDDWLRVLVAHEMTHVVYLDKKSGLPQVVNYVFGGMMHPNQYMPRWYTEACAVFDESLLSAAGRERSSLFEMFIRTDMLMGDFMEIDQISGSVDRWPRGNIPYLYGAKFMQYTADKYGNKTLTALGYLYGQRLVPLALNAVMKKVTGDTYIRLYDEWREQLRARYAADTKRLEALGLSEVHYLSDSGEEHGSPRLFPTGDRMLYFQDNGRPGERGWYVLDFRTDERKKLFEADEDGGADIAPDGRRIVSGQLAYYKNEYYYYDLYLYDRDRQETTRLTEGLRAREPSFSPDGRKVVFVKYEPGMSRLMLLDVDSRIVSELPRKLPFDQVFTPAWSPDGKRIAFTGWRLGGFKDLYLYDLENGQLSAVTEDRALDAAPNWSADGRTLFWSSDRTGIYNIYALDLEHKTVSQISNVLTGVFTPLVTPDNKRIYVSAYRPKGFDLAWIDLEKENVRPEPELIELRPAQDYRDPEVPYVDREYSPFPTLFPKLWESKPLFWMPTLGTDYAGSTLGVLLRGEDIVGEHAWTLEFDVGLESGDPAAGLSYSYRGWFPKVGFRAAHSSYKLRNAGLKARERVDQDESRTSGSVYVDFPFRSREYHGDKTWVVSHNLNFGYNFAYTRLLNRYEYDPLETPPVFAETGLSSGLSLGWSYQNRRWYPGYVSTAEGRVLYLFVRGNTSVLGSEVNNLSVFGGYAEYIAIPGVEGHTLALRFSGGFGVSDWRHRSVYVLGGPPKIDIVDSIINNNRPGGDFVRGYKELSISGDKFFLAQTEYRFQVWRIERGLFTLPVFFRRVHAAPFFDFAYAWSGDFNLKKMKTGIGGELRFDVILGYFTPVTFRVGYQYGFASDGVNELFFGLDNIF